MKEINAEKVVPDISIEIGGKVRTLKFNFFGLCQFQKKTGKNILTGDLFTGTPNPEDLLAFVWSALITDDPTLDIDELGKAIPFQELTKIPLVIQEAFKNLTPDVDPESKEKKGEEGTEKKISLKKPETKTDE